MSLEETKARLTLEEAEAAWVEAKKSNKKDAVYKKAEKVVVEARNEWRTNWR